MTAVSKALLNRLTVEGANALLDDAVRAALLEEMAEIALGDPRADIAGVDPPDDEAEQISALRVVRTNVGPLVTPSARMQAILEVARLLGYGPLNAPECLTDATDPDGNGYATDLVVGGIWYRTQRPMRGVVLPSPAAPAWACSTMVNVVLSTWLNAARAFRRANGANITAALERQVAAGGFREYASPAFGGGPVTWGHLLEHANDDELGDVNVVRVAFRHRETGRWRSPSHVVLVLRCGPGHLEVTDPRTGEACAGLWRVAADGSYVDVPSYEAVRDRRPGAYRAYSYRPTTIRPVDESDQGRAYVHRVVQLRPDGLTPWVHGGTWHLHEPCGLRVRLAA